MSFSPLSRFLTSSALLMFPIPMRDNEKERYATVHGATCAGFRSP